MAKFGKQVKAILEEGIKEWGTRYFLQCKLVYHFWSLNYSKEKCYEVIRRWYLSHDHQSKDWKKNPDRVLRQLRSAVNSLYRNAALKGYRPKACNRKSLNVDDVRKIVRVTTYYRKQKFIFSLLEYALNMKDTNNQFRLPKKAIIKFDCCSSASYQEKIQFCQSIGLITKVREYYRQDQRARTYHINYTFAKDGELVDNLEDGLGKIFDERDLRNRYSRQYLHHIMKGKITT